MQNGPFHSKFNENNIYFSTNKKQQYQQNKTKKPKNNKKLYKKKRKTRKNKTKQPPLPPPPLSKIIPKFNKKIIETVANSKHVSPNAHIYELSLSYHSTGFLILTGGVELGLRSPISFFLQWCGHATVFHMRVQSQPSHITEWTGWSALL